MASDTYNQQNPSAVTRRPPLTNDERGNNSQRAPDRRSLSGRLRNLFHKQSPSPTRSSSNDRRPATKPVRQSSSSPDASGLRAPPVYWPFGKKKSKVPEITTTPKTNKKKPKDNRTTKNSSAPPTEISSPIYDQENRPLVYGQNFVPRNSEPTRNTYDGLPTAPTYDTNPRRDVDNYRTPTPNQPYQQAVEPDVNVSISIPYTYNYTPPTSVNRPNLQNPSIDYYYPPDSSMPSITRPLADVEVINTPQPKRKVGDTPPITNPQRIVDKPPMFPETTLGPPSTAYPSNRNSNPNQWNTLPSSTYKPTEMHSTPSLHKDDGVPKLNTPLVNLGSTSSKKKPKRTKSQSRGDDVYASTSTIDKLAITNPVQPHRLNPGTYGSLPDAEFISPSNLNPTKTPQTNTNRYPGLSAIVLHHARPPPVYYNERPPIKPIKTPTPQPARRYDTSTTTLDDYDRNEPWSPYSPKDTSTSTSNLQRHDGYIRPLSPEQPTVTVDVNVYHLGLDDLRRSPPSPTVRISCYDSPEPTGTYRSSKTIYTRDRTRVGSGEIRTWSSPDIDYNDNRNDVCRCPYSFVEVDRPIEYNKDVYHPMLLPGKKDNFEEFRYSPRAHEQDRYEKPRQTTNENDRPVEEERYEISYLYDGQNQYTYEKRHYYDQSEPANPYLNEPGGTKNLVTSNPLTKMQPPNYTERDYANEQTPRSYPFNEYAQEPLLKRTPVDDFEQRLHTCTLKRTNSYDGLGILLSTDNETLSNHLIREVEPNSPGYRAGLRRNDRIISINGVNIENVHFDNVLNLIKQGLDNDNLQLSVIHDRDFI